jgi:hypothetical protein
MKYKIKIKLPINIAFVDYEFLLNLELFSNLFASFLYIQEFYSFVEERQFIKTSLVSSFHHGSISKF